MIVIECLTPYCPGPLPDEPPAAMIPGYPAGHNLPPPKLDAPSIYEPIQAKPSSGVNNTFNFDVIQCQRAVQRGLNTPAAPLEAPRSSPSIWRSSCDSVPRMSIAPSIEQAWLKSACCCQFSDEGRQHARAEFGVARFHESRHRHDRHGLLNTHTFR